MTPIVIDSKISVLNNKTLRNKINYLSYTFCVNADFTKEAAMKDLIDRLEMNMMEGLLRVLNAEVGYRPYQNKIYEQVERIFGDQDSYNINRMMSSLRRTKLVPVDPTNEKYINWMKNRVKYGAKAIMAALSKDFVTIE